MSKMVGVFVVTFRHPRLLTFFLQTDELEGFITNLEGFLVVFFNKRFPICLHETALFPLTRALFSASISFPTSPHHTPYVVLMKTAFVESKFKNSKAVELLFSSAYRIVYIEECLSLFPKLLLVYDTTIC